MVARPAVGPFRGTVLSLAVALDVLAVYFAATGTRGDLAVLPWLIALPLGALAFRDKGRPPWDRRDFAAIGALLIVALASRLLFIERWPSFINPDEPIFGLLAVDLLDGKTPAFVRGWLGEPYVSLVPFTLGLRLFGQRIDALRIPDGIIGAVAIPALYLVGRQAYDRIVGLFAALFLLANVAVFHISRTGLSNVQSFTLMAFGAGALLVVLTQPHRQRQWAILGLTVGLALCVFSAALIWPVISAIAILPLVPRLLRDRDLLACAAFPFVACFLIAAGPMLLYLLRAPGDLGGHALNMAVWNKEAWDHEINSYHLQQGDGVGIWRTQVEHSLAGLISLGDTQQDYGSERGLLDPVAGVFFVVGVVVLARQWRRPATLLLLTWVGLALLLGAIIIVDPPQTTKLIVIMPAAGLVAAVGLATTLRTLLDKTHQGMIAAVGVGCIVVGAAFGFSYYFGRYQLLAGQSPTLLAEYARSVADQRIIYLVNLDIPPDYEMTRFLAPRAKVFTWDTTNPVPARPANANLAFVMSVDGDGGQRAQAAVRARYPGGSELILSDPNGRPTLRVWQVPS